MKTLIVVFTGLTMLLAPGLSQGQTPQVEKLFDHYSGADGFTTVDISKGLFELFANVETDDPDFDDFKKAIEGIEKMRLLAWSFAENKDNTQARDEFMSRVKSTVPFKEYDELMVVREKDNKINFYSKSEKDHISELLMIVDGNEDAVILSIVVHIDLSRIAKLGS